MQNLPAVPKEYVDLLIWIIGILIFVITVLSGVVVYLHRSKERDSKIIMEHIGKTNVVLQDISVAMKDVGHSNLKLTDSIKDLHTVTKTQNDLFPRIIKALTGKDV
jgi:hypothetical protein